MTKTNHTIGEDAANVAIGEREALLSELYYIARENSKRNFLDVARAALTAEKVAGPKLSVMYGPMPESNGKTNWTAILHNGDIASGITLDRSEYPDRVRYEADRARWLIGELDKEPFILDYDADKHSGYVAPQQPAQPVAQTLALTDEQREAIEYAVRWMDENVSNRYAHTAAKELRALLAAQPASSVAEGGERE